MTNTTQALQDFLDSLSQIPGSILYRNRLAWEALPPGTNGQVLALSNDLLPQWESRAGYKPALITFNGSAQYYRRTTVTLSNNPHTFTIRTRRGPTAGQRCAFRVGRAGGWVIGLWLWSDHYYYVWGWNSAGTQVVQARSIEQYTDQNLHGIFVDYDNHNGTLVFEIDGQNADNLSWGGRYVNAATLTASGTGDVVVGSDLIAGRDWNGQLGYVGWKQVTGLSPSNFFDATGQPIQPDMTTWSQWSGQPQLFHESGKADENKGSLGSFTRNGTPLLANAELWS